MARRETINISLQPELLGVIRNDARTMGLSVSSYISFLCEMALEALPSSQEDRLAMVIKHRVSKNN